MKNIYKAYVENININRTRKKIAIAVVAPLLVAVMILTTLFSLRIALTATGDGWDLTNFATGVVVHDSNGNTVTNGNFLYGNNYTFSISFTENGTDQFMYNGGYLTYTLPPQLQVVLPVTDGDVLLPNGVVGGHYNLDVNGNVQVWFDNVDNQGVAITQNFIDRYQNAAFTLNIQAKFQQGASTGEIDFGADAKITVTQISEPPAGVKVTKGASTFDPISESIDYTVVIAAVGGPVDTVSLTDAMNLTGNNIPTAGYNITSGNSPTGFQYQVNGTGAWNSISPSWSGANMNFDFSGVGTLQPNQFITLKYSMPLSGVLDTLSTTPSATSPEIQRLMYALTLKNTATAAGRDIASKTMKNDTATTNTPMNKTFLAKTGSSTTSGGNNVITWTATVGDGSRSLNGQNIVDTLAATPAQTITGNITAKLYGYSGGAFTGPVTIIITPPTGLTAYNATGGFTYTVPNGSGSITDIRRVVFTYTTTAPTATGSVTYNNDLSYTLPTGNKNYVDKGVVVGPAFDIVKSEVWNYDTTGNPTGITYTVVATIPSGYATKNIYIQDAMVLTNDQANIMNRLFSPTNAPQNVTVTLDSPEPDFAYYLYTESGTSAYKWDMVFGPGVTTTSKSSWQYDTAKTLTITYTIPLDDTVYDSNGPETTIRDFLMNGHVGNSATGSDLFWYLNNEARVMYNGSGAKVYQTTDYWPIHKVATADPNDPTVFDYTVYLNPQAGYNHYSNNALFAAGSSAIFKDVFNSRLAYVPKSFYVLYSGKNIGGSGAFGPYTGSTGTLVSNATESPSLITAGNGSLSVDLSKLNQLNWSGTLSSATLMGSNKANWYANTYYDTTYEVHYQLKVSADYLADGFTAQNTATVNPNYTGSKYKGPFSSSATVKYGPTIVQKTIADINGNVLDTNIVINPNGADLVPDTPTGLDKTKFTAVDTMNGDLAFYMSTIEIYTQTKNPDGSWSGVWKTTPETISTTPGDLYSIVYIDAQHVNFVLPNETPVMIKYKALITVPVGSTANFNNTISVYGYSDYYAKDDFLVQNSAAGMFGDDLPITLYKQDQSTGQRLVGAQFGLYVNMPSNGVPYSGYTVDPAHPAITVGSKTFYYILEGTDTGNGTYRFYDNTHGLLYSGSTFTYLIVETAAPSGYKLPASPNNRTYFVLRSLSSSDKTTLQTQLGATVNVVADTMTLTNTPLPLNIKIPVTKNISGADARDGTYQFTCTQVHDSGCGALTSSDTALTPDAAGSLSITTSGKTGTGSFDFSNVLAGTYYFKISEQGTAPVGWTYDSGYYVVQVDTYADGSSRYLYQYFTYPLLGGLEIASAVVFTNSYNTSGSVTLTAQKNATGATLTAGLFNFEVKEGSTVVATGTNATGGSITFTTINYNAAGTHDYTVDEVNDGLSGWTYDSTVFDVTVNVVDNGDGTLTATPVYPSGGIIYNNAYIGGPLLPLTGGIGTTIFHILSAILTVGLVVFFVIRRKRNILNLK